MPSTRSQSTPATMTEPFPEGGLFRLLQCVAIMLLFARVLVPAEVAVLGGSLWITQLWILAIFLWGWDAYRRGDYRLRWGAIDAAIWVVVLGHGVSTWYVLTGRGDSRSALNLFWEWVGLGCAFFLIRQSIRTTQDRGRVLVLFLALAVTLSGYSIWQHYVEIPQVARDYDRIIQELRELSGPNAGRDVIRLERELEEMGVPFLPMARQRFEDRIRSTEPFATFALANTLAGFLAAWLFVLIDWLCLGVMQSKGRARSPWRIAGKFAGVLLIGYCLVLTKSRTAWLGVVLGFATWAILRGARSVKFSRQRVLAGAGLVLVLVGFFLIARQSGGFNWEVISEAPKSLEYRRQYWTGAWEVVRHHPWLGIGPGNFRQHYLHYKLPESSEEIADPHNWILDLWASGGLLALGGFAVVLVLAVRAGRRNRQLVENHSQAEPASLGVSAWETGAALSIFLVLVVGWFSADPFDARLIGVLAGGVVAWAILQWKQVFRAPWAGILAGGLAILVHLLGAGGIEMPAITQTIFLLIVFLFGASWENETPHSLKARPKTVAVVCGLAFLSAVLCWQTATKPVWYRVLLVRSGDGTLSQEHNPREAAKWYAEAHEADPYSSEPLERLAELHLQAWRRIASERDFEQAVEYARSAIPLDPVSHRIYGQLGRMYLERAKRLFSLEEAKLAVEFLTEAAARYPSSSAVRAELALALDEAGQLGEAAQEAAKALELDEINREAGHVDKFLPEVLVKVLEEIQQ